jgi:flavin reductase (DIM6/NTAB) family NADH-FMN oxidoreductase RutF
MKVNGNMNKFYYYAFPMQSVLVTCNNEHGKTNVITIAWHTPISKNPPLYGISVAPSRYSYELINNSKEFVINFAPYNLLDKVHFCGTHSGRNIDKIEEVKLTLMPSQKVNVPLIKECFAHLECKLYKTLELEDHTFFIGVVVNLMADEKAFIDDVIDNSNFQPCYYIGNNIYTTIMKKRRKF